MLNKASLAVANVSAAAVDVFYIGVTDDRAIRRDCAHMHAKQLACVRASVRARVCVVVCWGNWKVRKLIDTL